MFLQTNVILLYNYTFYITFYKLFLYKVLIYYFIDIILIVKDSFDNLKVKMIIYYETFYRYSFREHNYPKNNYSHTF